MKINYCYFIITVLFMAVLIAGCAGKTQVQTGINLSDTYIAMHAEYLNIYESADEKTREYMKEKIAPKMNRVKHEIIDYNEIVLNDEDGTGKRDAIMAKLRELSRELTGVK